MDGIISIERGDARFPHRLAALTGGPSTLYCRGNTDLLHAECIAVVGTRQATDYGIEATRAIVTELVRAGVTIVSGLALGIDAVAHRATLDAGGSTIAVLGSGVDDATIGPRQNLPLARDILANGGLVCSEYPAGTRADTWTFPARNRIVSGLSRAVIVTEAARKSGALITARLAAEQGRDVCAVPGSMFWPRSAGPNELIRNGAHVIAEPSDVLDVLGIQPRLEHVAVSTQDPVQQKVIAILANGPAHVDAIVSGSDAPTPAVMAALTKMELTGSVSAMHNGYWRKT